MTTINYFKKRTKKRDKTIHLIPLHINELALIVLISKRRLEEQLL